MVALAPIDLLLLVLGTWRLSAMLSYESGPWHIFEKARETFDVEHDESTGYPIQWPDRLAANLFVCVWCLSIWVGLLLVIIYQVDPVVMRLVVAPFAISAGAIIVERFVR